MVWLIAADADVVVGSGLGIHGCHSPPGVRHLDLHVLPDTRRRGTGSALLDRLADWLGERGCEEATATVFAEDAASLAWAWRRERLPSAEHDERGTERADPPPEPPARIRRRARFRDGERTRTTKKAKAGQDES